MNRFTILGAGGFIGRVLTASLRADGHEVVAVDRAGLDAFLACRFPAGHVINCIGMTGDFRLRPRDTAQAHVGIVAQVLANVEFASFLLLSSTRVYDGAERGHEDATLLVQPALPDEVYNLTKLAGEALCLSDPRPSVRVARLSNVYGPGMGRDTFLGQVLAEGFLSGRVALRQNLRSAKDYVALPDVVRLLPRIAEAGRARLYNVASGTNVTHDAVMRCLAAAFGWSVTVAENAPVQRFPRIDVSRLRGEFGAPSTQFLDALPALGAGVRQEVACLRSMKPAGR